MRPGRAEHGRGKTVGDVHRCRQRQDFLIRDKRDFAHGARSEEVVAGKAGQTLMVVADRKDFEEQDFLILRSTPVLRRLLKGKGTNLEKNDREHGAADGEAYNSGRRRPH
jgi:hypothetical protein